MVWSGLVWSVMGSVCVKDKYRQSKAVISVGMRDAEMESLLYCWVKKNRDSSLFICPLHTL